MITSNTESFLNLLRHYAVGERYFTKDDLDLLANSNQSIMPPIGGGLWTSEASYAAKCAFSYCVLNGELDWQVIRDEAARLSTAWAANERTRQDAKQETKFLSIAGLDDSPVAIFARKWTEAWNRRNLEVLISLFSDGGIYLDLLSEKAACGREDLRRLFSYICHQEPLKLEITGVAVELAPNFELRWVKEPLIQTSATSAKPRKGRSVVALQGAQATLCVEIVDEDPLEEVMRPIGRIWVDKENGIVWIGNLRVPLKKRNTDGG